MRLAANQPNRVTAVMITAAMSATRSPYSTAVAPFPALPSLVVTT